MTIGLVESLKESPDSPQVYGFSTRGHVDKQSFINAVLEDWQYQITDLEQVEHVYYRFNPSSRKYEPTRGGRQGALKVTHWRTDLLSSAHLLWLDGQWKEYRWVDGEWRESADD